MFLQSWKLNVKEVKQLFRMLLSASYITHVYIRSVYQGSRFTCYVILMLVWLYVAG